MGDAYIGAALALASAVAKLTQLGFELAAVEDDLLPFRDTLEHDYNRLEFIRTELSRKYHLLEPGILSEIDSVLQSCQQACDNITLLIDGPLKQIKKKGKVSFGKRIEWVFSDSTLARAWNNYRQTTHVSLMSVWSLLLQLQPHQSSLSPLSSYNKTLSSVQHNNYEQGLIRFAPKPQDSTIRAKSSPLLIGGVPVGKTCSQDSGSAGLGHGVNERSKSAGTLGTLSCKLKDHIRDYDSGTGAILARREIDRSRRHRPDPDTKMV